MCCEALPRACSGLFRAGRARQLARLALRRLGRVRAGGAGGVFCIGAVLVLRDWLQQLRGLLWTMPLVYAAGLASWGIGDAAGWTRLEKIAVASVVAFTVSETLEAIVFTPLRKRSLTLGVAVSGTAGNALDSWLFLQLAFGSQAFFTGQFIGKGEMIALGTLLTF